MKKIIILVAIFAFSCSQGKSDPVDGDTEKPDSDEKLADIEQTDDSSDVTHDNKVDEDVQTIDEKQDESDDDAEDDSSVDNDSVEVDIDDLEEDDDLMDEDIQFDDFVQPDEDIQPDDFVQPDEDIFLSGNEYYCDPVSGLIGNDGSKDSPWPDLAAVFAAKKTFSAGDVIYLRSGAHGEPFITGINSDYVHVIGYPGEKPVIASIQMESSKFWAFKDVSFSSDGTGGTFTRNYMFSANDTAEYVKIENCQ